MSEAEGYETQNVDIMSECFEGCETAGIFGQVVTPEETDRIINDPLIEAIATRLDYDTTFDFLRLTEKRLIAISARNFLEEACAEAGYAITLIGGQAEELLQRGEPNKYRDVDLQLIPRSEEIKGKVDYARDLIETIRKVYRDKLNVPNLKGSALINNADTIFFEIPFTEIDHTLPHQRPFYGTITRRGISTWQPSLSMHLIYNGIGIKIMIAKSGKHPMDTALVEIGNPIVRRNNPYSQTAKPSVIPAIKYDEDRRRCLIFDSNSKKWISIVNKQEIKHDELDPFTRAMMFVRHLKHTGQYELSELEALDMKYISQGIVEVDQHSDLVHLLFLRRLSRSIRSMMFDDNSKDIFIQNDFALVRKFYPLLYHSLGLGIQGGDSYTRLVKTILSRQEFKSFGSLIRYHLSILTTLESNLPRLIPKTRHPHLIEDELIDPVRNALFRHSPRTIEDEMVKRFGPYFADEMIESMTGQKFIDSKWHRLMMESRKQMRSRPKGKHPTHTPYSAKKPPIRFRRNRI